MVIGHQKQWQFLKKSAELEKLSHAYLFSGQEKLGKKTIAIEWISLLFGENIQKKLHPDFILIGPINREIQISQIRDLNWKLSLKPSIAPLKVAIIDQAHLMNEEAQNCFLKTLEEPKGNTLLILITSHPEFLFPTILSRCQIIKFYPVERKEIESYLRTRALAKREDKRSSSTGQGISENEVKVIADISLGRPGAAIDFLKNPQKLESRQRVIKELIEISNLSLAGRFQYAGKLTKGSNVREILEIWLSYFRNVLLEQCLNFEVKHRQHSFLRLKNIIKQIQNTSFLISTTNVNPRLALEILMLDL